MYEGFLSVVFLSLNLKLVRCPSKSRRRSTNKPFSFASFYIRSRIHLAGTQQQHPPAAIGRLIVPDCNWHCTSSSALLAPWNMLVRFETMACWGGTMVQSPPWQVGGLLLKGIVVHDTDMVYGQFTTCRDLSSQSQIPIRCHTHSSAIRYG